MSPESTDSLQCITIDEAAKRLSISTRTIHREISAGRFPRPIKIGRSARVPVSALLAYIQRLSTQSLSS